MNERRDRVFLSDDFLKRSTFKDIVKMMNDRGINKNIVIVGASHSGFSAAWMLMNGPADILHNTHVNPSC